MQIEGSFTMFPKPCAEVRFLPGARRPIVRPETLVVGRCLYRGAATEFKRRSGMACEILNVTFDCGDSDRVSAFWQAVTSSSRHLESDPGNEYWVVESEDGHWPRLVFVTVPEGKSVKNRVHLDLVPRESTQASETERLVPRWSTSSRPTASPRSTSWCRGSATLCAWRTRRRPICRAVRPCSTGPSPSSTSTSSGFRRQVRRRRRRRPPTAAAQEARPWRAHRHHRRHRCGGRSQPGVPLATPPLRSSAIALGPCLTDL